MIRSLRRLAALAAACCTLLTGCWDAVEAPQPPDGHDYERVLVLAALGYNNLSDAIRGNIRSIESGALPTKDARKAVLVLSHLSEGNTDWTTPTGVYLIQLYQDEWGKAVRDTLKTFRDHGFLTDPALLTEGLQYVKDHFDAAHYGLILSSHGTGWLPEGYYENGSQTSYQWNASARRFRYHPVQASADRPAVKSFGCEARREGGKAVAYEMSLADLAAAIPMKLDYIIFDACLMGGVEVAWELRGVTDQICFSPAEVISNGFYYAATQEHLLTATPAATEAFSRAFFDHYNANSGSWQTATVTVVDCTRLEPLAEVCADLFERYRSQIAAVVPDQVQGYFTGQHHWFYDLKDILTQAGLPETELQRVQEALDQCIRYTAHTPRILNEVPLTRCCGLSMYLPCNGDATLDAFYGNLAWNQRTLLVK